MNLLSSLIIVKLHCFQVSTLKTLICKIETNNYKSLNLETRQHLKLFYKTLIWQPINFTFYEFYDIDTSYSTAVRGKKPNYGSYYSYAFKKLNLLQVALGIISYLVILVQFQAS